MAGEKPYLFVCGAVGCGKTMLSKSAAESCRRKIGESTHLSANFVLNCSFSSTTNQHLGLNDLLRYLLAQLSSLHSFSIALYEVYGTQIPPEPPNDNDKLKEVLSKIIAGPLLPGSSLTPKMYILLDGLDEIAEISHCRQVTDFLNDLATTSLRDRNLHILVTSRSLGLSNPWQPMWEQYAIPVDKVVEDIERYVRWTVSSRFNHLAAHLQRKIIERLTGPKQTM
jgi:hypothetical protein